MSLSAFASTKIANAKPSTTILVQCRSDSPRWIRGREQRKPLRFSCSRQSQPFLLIFLLTPLPPYPLCLQLLRRTPLQTNQCVRKWLALNMTHGPYAIIATRAFFLKSEVVKLKTVEFESFKFISFPPALLLEKNNKSTLFQMKKCTQRCFFFFLKLMICVLRWEETGSGHPKLYLTCRSTSEHSGGSEPCLIRLLHEKATLNFPCSLCWRCF